MTASTVVDKSQAGRDARQYHIGIAPGEVSSVALLPGIPSACRSSPSSSRTCARSPTTASTAR